MTRQSPEEELKKKLWSILYPDFPEGIELAKYEIRINQVMQALSTYTERETLKRAIEEIEVLQQINFDDPGFNELPSMSLDEYLEDHINKIKVRLEKLEKEG